MVELRWCKIYCAPKFDGIPEAISSRFEGLLTQCHAQVFTCMGKEYLCVPHEEGIRDLLLQIEVEEGSSFHFRNWFARRDYPKTDIPFFLIPREYAEFVSMFA